MGFYRENPLKIQYLGPGLLWVRHILNLLVSRCEWSFRLNMVNYFAQQYKPFHCYPTPVETSPDCELILCWTENYGYEWTVVLLKRDVHSEWGSTPESISVKSRTFSINIMFIYVERTFSFSKHLEWLFDCSAVSKIECNQKKSLHSPWRSIK